MYCSVCITLTTVLLPMHPAQLHVATDMTLTFALHDTILHNASYSTAPYCTAALLHCCTAPQSTARTVLHRIVLLCMTVRTAALKCTVMHCTSQHHNALHPFSLYELTRVSEQFITDQRGFPSLSSTKGRGFHLNVSVYHTATYT